MSHPMDGAWTKVNRANVHLGFLEERVKAFINSDANRFDWKPDPQILERLEMAVYAEALTEPPAEEWGAIIGDVVHNLRSALDHLVWQLTLANGNTPPAVIPRGKVGKKWRDIRFPIHIDPYPLDHLGNLMPWATSKEPKSLWGIRPSLRTDFEGLQPFTHGQNAPKEPLAVLDELWNIDKHRHLPLTSFHLGLHDVTSRQPEFKFRILKKHPSGPLKGRAEIGRIEHIGPPFTPFYEMYVQTYISFDVAFEKGPPAYGGRVVDTLITLRDTVSRILAKFDSEFP